MSSIHTLPPHLIAQIAAGEVIERPAFVVKELVENALDAGATQLDISVTKGGLEAITVTDNGKGMDADDLFLSWQPHTTSKTPPDSDLTMITTLGFRGEALSSIAAVSEFTMQSRVAGEAGGTQLEVSHGKFRTSSPVGMAPGTTVKVEHLFASLPARQKFLSSPQTEWRHIAQVVESYALAYPEVQFRLTHNGRRVLDAPAQILAERVTLIYGSEVAGQTFPFVLEAEHFSMQGFLGRPQASFHMNLPSYLIVNRRVSKNRALTQALKNAYRGLLKVEATPFFVLTLETPYEMVDVNIHPRKEEVAFLNEQELTQSVATKVTKLAQQQNLSYRWSTPPGDTSSFAAQSVREDVLSSLESIPPNAALMQLQNLYILTPTNNGLLLIDQHAAHERVLYERLITSYKNKQRHQKSHTFSSPLTLTLPLSQAVVLEEQLGSLAQHGFAIEKSTENTFLIHSVPELLRDRDPLQLFQDILHDVEQADGTNTIDRHTNRMLSFLACRMAIKAGEGLTPTRMKKLVRELAETKTPYTCPHGRPTHIEISLGELEKLFGRK